MATSQVSLVPSNLAGRPPVVWTSQEVRAWLEFCVTEFSLRPVCVDKFDMNGKALLLLTRTDFIERAPHAGDILYNVFQRLLQQGGPGYLRSPIFLPTSTHFISPNPDILPRPVPAQSTRAVYIPIRPQTQTLVCSSSRSSTNSSSACPTTGSLILGISEEPNNLGPGVPASLLSPAPSEKCSTDADSANNESGQSPHETDRDMEYNEDANFDPGSNLKCSGSHHQNDSGVCRLLWEFIYQLLQDNKWSELVSWESLDDLTFRIQNPTNLADAWGKQKNRSNMTYEKLSRALRYYYKMNIIKKVPGKQLTYKFLQHPAAIRKGQRGARPHSSKTLAARTAEIERSPTGTITPDSSTFLPPRSMSNPSTSSPTSTPVPHDFTGNMASPKREYASDETLEVDTDRYDPTENPLMGLCQEVKDTSHGHSSFLSQDATSVDSLEIFQNVTRVNSVSPEKHFVAMEKSPDIFCRVLGKRESGDRSPECRSQTSFLDISPRIDERHWSPKRMEVNNKHPCNLSLLNDPLDGHGSPLMLSSPEYKLQFLSLPDRKHSEQKLQPDMDTYVSSSGSPLCVSNSIKSRVSDQFNAMKNPKDIMQNFLYSNDLYHNQHHHRPYYLSHPYPHSRSYNLTAAHSPRGHEQLPSTARHGDYYNRLRQNPLKDPHIVALPRPADGSTGDAGQPIYTNQTMKSNPHGQEQEEPEDLSMKLCSRTGELLGKKVKSENDLPRVSRVKDVHRESPRSCSADSAYGSVGEFARDASVDELHE